MGTQVDMVTIEIENLTRLLCNKIKQLDENDKICTLNNIRQKLHAVSPLNTEPVDCVLWIPSEHVIANDYNPNQVAPPEMRLLKYSITKDGYTQPIVGFQKPDHVEVVDGFHRNRVGKEYPEIRKRIKGYLPITFIKNHRSSRIASTIRHNRARGKHLVEGMSEIVQELSRRNWSDKRIAKELGMDQDEILRLKQITGLTELFSDEDFSEAWE